MVRLMLSALVLLFLGLPPAAAELLTRAEIEAHVQPPFLLGEPADKPGVWTLLNTGGTQAGWIFETGALAPLPGFSGAVINVLVTLDLEGGLHDARLIHHNEPIFVSGLGQAAFESFFEQYGGLSIRQPLVVGQPYGSAAGDGSALTYLDGVTKATASVRIAHESILAAALDVARASIPGLSAEPPARPDPQVDEPLTWADLVAQGIASHHVVRNAEVQTRFVDTLWERDDPAATADPEAPYLDLWVVDIGPPSVARAVLSDQTLQELRDFMTISTEDEPILVIETARHGLVSDKFVRNTAPDWLSAEQGGLPVALRDADLWVELVPEAPQGRAMILRSDRRLGFDPASPWVLKIEATRQHGMFQPQIGSVTFEAPHDAPDRFYTRPEVPRPLPPWRAALRDRQGDLIILALALAGLLAVLAFAQSRLAGHRHYTPIRLAVLAVVLGFVGFWGQGQLSIVTVLGVIRTAWEGGSFAFLLFDPFSLLIWGVTILGFVLWGRGLFCGWLCPFGAMQEFAHHLGRLLRLPVISPNALWDRRLKALKYLVLAGLVALVFVAPDRIDTAAEVEPFKTAITTFFVREWYYVAYAVGLLLLSMVLFKGFCRYLCPLGAVMAIGGLLRGRDWIARRAECGSPCQLCRVKCNYGAIRKTGAIDYSECFQCLDCVTIHDDPTQCVPLVLQGRAAKRPPRITGHPNEAPA